jgi:hypothetical protein
MEGAKPRPGELNELRWHENRKSQNPQMIRNPLDPKSSIVCAFAPHRVIG